MEFNIIIRNLVIIVAILGIAFLSQLPDLRYVGKKWYPEAKEKTYGWLGLNLYPKIVGDLQKKGEEVKQGAIDVKDNFFISIWENIKKYFAEKFTQTFGTKVE